MADRGGYLNGAARCQNCGRYATRGRAAATVGGVVKVYLLAAERFQVCQYWCQACASLIPRKVQA